MIKDFTKLRLDMQTALNALSTEYNCEFNIGNIKYDDVTAKISVELVEKGKDIGAEENLFNTYCARYGFEPKHYGRLIEVNGKYYKFIGFNIDARKNFCIFSKGDQKFALSPERALASLNS